MASPTPLRLRIRDNLRFSFYDGFFFSVMSGLSESYVPAFALFLGIAEAEVGLLTSVPMLLGALLQLIGPRLLSRASSHKGWVVFTAFLQALTLVPLIFFAFQGVASFSLLLLVFSLYWGTGFASGTVWNYWMGFLVPQSLSSSYFSMRTRYTQFGVLVGLVGGGLILQMSPINEKKSLYAGLYGLAVFARLISCFFLSKKSAEPALPSRSLDFFRDLKKFFESRDRLKFFGFLFLFYCGVYLSSPFVAPYLLVQNQFSYLKFMGALAVFLIAKIGVSRVTPKLVVRFGVEKVFLAGAFGVAPLPALWMVSDSFYFAVFLQSLSGIFWGAFEVGLSLIFFKKIPHDEKVSLLTLHNVFNATAIFLGGVMGHQILIFFGPLKQAYYVVFGVSTLARLLCLLPFYKILFELLKQAPWVFRVFNRSWQGVGKTTKKAS